MNPEQYIGLGIGAVVLGFSFRSYWRADAVSAGLIASAREDARIAREDARIAREEAEAANRDARAARDAEAECRRQYAELRLEVDAIRHQLGGQSP